MEALYLIVLLLAVLALNWRGLGLRPVSLSRSACRWKKDPTRNGATLMRYSCAKCGGEAYTSDGRAPNRCKRAFRETGL